mmetsp:Transcript_39682/g.118085  ORF Transcript_39682/g.118085 Transcript_39682/m.118085 type:complete len:245 (+) Transcript_39682:578-1312(+)
MRLARQAGHAPALHHTLCAVTLGDGDGVNHLVRLEDRVNRELLLKQRVAEVNLLSDRATVDLDLHQVRLLLAHRHLLDLGVRQHTNHTAVLLQLLQLGVNGLLALGVLLHVLGEALLLGHRPVLVEPALDLVAQVLCPDGVERAQATRCLDVADDTDDDHGRRLNDRHRLHGLLLVQLGAGLLHLAQNVGRASLVADESRQMRRLGGVILGERLHLTASTAAALLGQEAQGAVPWVLELAMRHL